MKNTVEHVFLDTNILIDLIADRKPFSSHAIKIFSLAEQDSIKIYTSSHSIATTHYMLKKYIQENKLREILLNLTDYMNVISVDFDMLKKSLRSGHKDFEDAIQIICATSFDSMDCIVTRNIKDFKTSELLVLTPDQFCLGY